MSELILALGLAGFAAPAEAPDLAQIWEREVLLGDVAKAARDYKRIYQDELRNLPLDVRRRAAFRAGACFERLGQTENARYAYRWLAESEQRSGAKRLPLERPGGDAILVAKARARLRDLPRSEDLALGVSLRAPERGVKDAIEVWERELEATNAELTEIRNELQVRLAVARRVDAALLDLKRGYGALGLILGPPSPPPFQIRKAVRGSSEERFDGFFRHGVLPERIGSYATRALLAWHWHRKALLECVSSGKKSIAWGYTPARGFNASVSNGEGDAAATWELCAYATENSRQADAIEEADLRATRQRLQGLVGAQLEAAARRELLDTHLQAWTAVGRSLRQVMSNARRLVADRQRTDYALSQELFDIPKLLDGVLSPVLEERQVEALLREARELIFLLGHGVIEEERLAELWRQRRRLRDEVLLAVAARLELASKELTEVVIVSPGVDTDVDDLGRGELARQVEVVSAALERADVLESEVQLEVLEQLRGWFPGHLGVDYRGPVARLARRLVELRSKEQEVDATQ